MITYSVIIPVNNEEENLPQLFKELFDVLVTLGGEFEVICIDDGSTDNSLNVLEEMKGKYAGVKIIKFDRNYRKSAALVAGFKECLGEIVIIIDADLQNNPADIPEMLTHLPEYDVVNGRRLRRQDSFIRLLSSRIGNGIRNIITGDDIADTACGFKVFKASFVKHLVPFSGMHRFLPFLCKLEGAKVIEIGISHRERFKGEAHYGVGNRAMRGLFDALAMRWLKTRHLRYKVEKVI